MSKKRTNKEFVEQVKQAVGNEYLFLDEYVDNHTKIRVLHKTCGHIYEVTPICFLNMGRRCPKCKGGVKKTSEEFIKQFYEIAKDEYLLLSNYINAKTKIKVRHKVCGHEYYVKPSKFLSNQKCPKCFGSYKKTTEEFRKEINNLTKGEYDILDDYLGANQKIRFIHKKCGEIFCLKPNTFLSGSRCPICQESKGEKRIEHYFIDNNVRFERQKTFENCKNKNKLKFDFYLPDYNLCIEYDGEYHYYPIFKNNSFELQKKRDLIKDLFCYQNGIELIRIPYWNFDKIEEILEKILSSKNVNIKNQKEESNG